MGVLHLQRDGVAKNIYSNGLIRVARGRYTERGGKPRPENGRTADQGPLVRRTATRGAQKRAQIFPLLRAGREKSKPAGAEQFTASHGRGSYRRNANPSRDREGAIAFRSP